MDIVITYVDGNDPAWKKDYEKYTSVPVMEKRFRDWGTLKYLLRGIETKMPFIRNVYLVVSHESQAPQWADRENLKIVLHRDIIPEKYLPTFNSTAIEIFLHRIPGLDEEYLYFNDDMFPVGDCRATDFFNNGTGFIGFSRHLLAIGQYKKHCRNSDMMSREALGMPKSIVFVRPQHICSPMLKSECEAVFEKMKPQLLASLSMLREDKNINQYVYLDYMLHKGRIVNRRIPKKHFSAATAGADEICAFIKNPTRTLCCINDVRLGEEKFTEMRDRILAAFEEKIP